MMKIEYFEYEPPALMIPKKTHHIAQGATCADFTSTTDPSCDDGVEEPLI